MNTILLATTQSWNSLPDDGLPEDVGEGPILDGGGSGSGISSVDGQPSQYPLYRIIVDVYAVSVLCLVGFVGNTLTIAVLHRDTDQPNTTNWLLQSLAVVDTLYLASCVFIQPIKVGFTFNHISGIHYYAIPSSDGLVRRDIIRTGIAVFMWYYDIYTTINNINTCFHLKHVYSAESRYSSSSIPSFTCKKHEIHVYIPETNACLYHVILIYSVLCSLIIN